MLCESADLLLQPLYLATKLLNNCKLPLGKETTSGFPSTGKGPPALLEASMRSCIFFPSSSLFVQHFLKFQYLRKIAEYPGTCQQQ